MLQLHLNDQWFNCLLRYSIILEVWWYFTWWQKLGSYWWPSHKWQTSFNSLWPNDAICRHKSGSILIQGMACCLMAPSHYLNHCWLIISEVLLHSLDDSFKGNYLDISHWMCFKPYDNNYSHISHWINDYSTFSWWHHQMEIFSALLTLSAGNPRSPVNYRTKASDVELYVSFDLRLNKRLNKQLWG